MIEDNNLDEMFDQTIMNGSSSQSQPTEAGLLICLTVPDFALRSEMPHHSLTVCSEYTSL